MFVNFGRGLWSTALQLDSDCCWGSCPHSLAAWWEGLALPKRFSLSSASRIMPLQAADSPAQYGVQVRSCHGCALQAVAEADGVALGGSAVFIPLLERCGTSAALQAARFPHPTLPPIRLQLQVPQLRFYFSPARIGRVMRAIEAVMPGGRSLRKVCLNSVACTPPMSLFSLFAKVSV